MIGKGMKRFFAFALAALVLLSGCCPGRTALSPSVSDSLQVEREVRYVEKLRDTVIYVEVPVESRRVRVAADSSFLETSLATSSARVAADGTLSHTLENKPQRQPVGVTVRDTFERESELSGSVRTERVEVPVKVPLSWFQKSLMGCGLFALAFGVGWAYRATKVRTVTVGPFLPVRNRIRPDVSSADSCVAPFVKAPPVSRAPAELLCGLVFVLTELSDGCGCVSVCY